MNNSSNLHLSPEQMRAFDLYKKGHNLFITGLGGSGKSVIIKTIFMDAQSQHGKASMTALTGCAALLLDCEARTLHSWAGIGLGDRPVPQLIRTIKSKKATLEVWLTTKLLIIDEVSMMSRKLFELLDTIGREIRENSRPFGGIQIICSGDFYQLCPVGNINDPATQQFCFESPIWGETFAKEHHCELLTNFRQSDAVFSAALRQVREGCITNEVADMFQSRVGAVVDATMAAPPTKLYPTRNLVEQINSAKLSAIGGEARVFAIKYHVNLDTRSSRFRRPPTEAEIAFEHKFLAANLRCDENITLKIGAVVMCVVNYNLEKQRGPVICNGSQGVVVGFVDTELGGYPQVRFNDGCVSVVRPFTWASKNYPQLGVSQVPLVLAWALTIHKAQGATMDAAEIDAGSGIFACGQTYVALSRVRNFGSLYLNSFDKNKIKCDAKVQRFYASLE